MAHNLIAISYAKRTLEPDSRERARMQSYAAHLTSYHVIVFTRQGEGFPAVQHDGSLHLYATNARTKLGMLWQSYRIGRTIIQQHPDTQFVVTSQDPFETSLVGRALARTRTVRHHVQIHGDVFNPASYTAALLPRVRVRYGRYVVRHTIAIRVVSARIKRSLVALGVAPDRITVLPVQADLAALLPLGASRQHIPQSPLRLLFLGRLAPEKQLSILINAVAILQTNQVAVQLHIVGAGPEAARLQQQVSSHHLEAHVTFTPWTDDITGVMQSADVFCLPSAHEGWGMVLLEAAASGLAIVTTDVGCVGETLISGEHVLVAHSEQQFADAITRLTDPVLRTTLADHAHQAATQFVAVSNNHQARVVAGHYTN